MQLHAIHAGYFKLDGGSMFGVVPKVLWNKHCPADSQNRCTWMARSLLIEEGQRLILVDTGLGNKQSGKFFSRYDPSGPGLLDSLKEKGFRPEDITDVFLTHLHFDHCGGALVRKGTETQITFPNAVYWSNETHWNHAANPNSKEKASFLKENFIPLLEAGRVKHVPETEGISFADHIRIRFVNGHTRAMMLPQIEYKGRTLVFVADLLPSVHHIPLPWIMAYDIAPLESLHEKEVFLKEAVEKEYILYFEHDPQNECCTLKKTDKGIRADRIFKTEDI